MITPDIENAVTRAVSAALAEEVKKAIDEECKAAAERIEKRIRAKSAEITASVTSWMNYMQNRNEVVITIKLPPENRKEGTQ